MCNCGNFFKKTELRAHFISCSTTKDLVKRAFPQREEYASLQRATEVVRDLQLNLNDLQGMGITPAALVSQQAIFDDIERNRVPRRRSRSRSPLSRSSSSSSSSLSLPFPALFRPISPAVEADDDEVVSITSRSIRTRRRPRSSTPSIRIENDESTWLCN